MKDISLFLFYFIFCFYFFIFFLFIFGVSSVYVLNNGPFSDVCFADIFSRSVACPILLKCALLGRASRKPFRGCYTFYSRCSFIASAVA